MFIICQPLLFTTMQVIVLVFLNLNNTKSKYYPSKILLKF